MNIGDWIKPFRPADGPPPQTLGAFMRWCLAGSWSALWLAAGLSAIAGALEAGTALILGMVIDATLASGPETFFDGRNTAMIAIAVGFFLIARPVLFGLSAASNSIMVQPNVNPMVLSRLHRWSLGQNVGFFDDDFAGRIAQKQMQAARAVTDVASEVINRGGLCAGIACRVRAAAGVNRRMDRGRSGGLAGAVPLADPLVHAAHPQTLRGAGRRAVRWCRGRSWIRSPTSRRSSCSPMTIIEDRAALDAMEGFRQRALEFGYLSAGFPICADEPCRHPAGAADRGDRSAVAARHGECGRHRGGRRHLASASRR